MIRRLYPLVSPLIALFLGGLTAPAIAQTQTVAVFNHGTAAGKVETGIREFLGVPFAQPPVGGLRWKPPAPLPPARAVIDATRFGNDCMQPQSLLTRLSKAPGMSEDCLSLNIWAPSGTPLKPLPVMVWIYGGSFLGGSASAFDGSALARKGVIVVAANYRTGLFGFLAHPLLTQESQDHTSGNYGLLDQIAALRWVQQNISSVGGDPRAVTLFGESSGASAVSLLMTSPLAKGLFSKAILESPGALRPLASLKDAEATGQVVGSDLSAMRALSEKDLVALTTRLVPTERSLTKPRVLGPIVDGYVLPMDERSAYQAGAIAHVPIVIGGNAQEGRLFVAAWPIKTTGDFNAFISDNFGTYAKQILGLYPIDNDAEVPARLSEIFADTQFNLGIEGVADATARLGSAVYRYRFTHQVAGLAPTHGAEVRFVFGLIRPAATTGSPSALQAASISDQKTSQSMIDAWTAFAQASNPSTPALTWPQYTQHSRTYVDFGEFPEVRTLPSSPRLQFLDCIAMTHASCSVP